MKFKIFVFIVGLLAGLGYSGFVNASEKFHAVSFTKLIKVSRPDVGATPVINLNAKL